MPADAARAVLPVLVPIGNPLVQKFVQRYELAGDDLEETIAGISTIGDFKLISAGDRLSESIGCLIIAGLAPTGGGACERPSGSDHRDAGRGDLRAPARVETLP